MKIERVSETEANVRLSPYVPALVIVFEADAAPHLFGNGRSADEVGQIMHGLTDEWRNLLLHAIETDPNLHPYVDPDEEN